MYFLKAASNPLTKWGIDIQSDQPFQDCHLGRIGRAVSLCHRGGRNGRVHPTPTPIPAWMPLWATPRSCHPFSLRGTQWAALRETAHSRLLTHQVALAQSFSVGLAKKFVRVCRTMLQKNPNAYFGQPKRCGFPNIFIDKPVSLFGTFSHVLLSSQVCFPSDHLYHPGGPIISTTWVS